jgi:hypothetical protein
MLFRAFLRGEGLMGKVMAARFGLLLLALGMTGCAGSMATAPVASAQQECERSGGIWKSSFCERSSGGGY